MALLG
jgi:hypothetical protein